MLKLWKSFGAYISRSAITRRNYMNKESMKVVVVIGGSTIIVSILLRANRVCHENPLLTMVHAKSLASMSDRTFSDLFSDKKSAIFRIRLLGDSVRKSLLCSGVLIDSESGLILSESVGEVGSKVQVNTVDMNVINGRIVAVDLELSLIQLEQPLSGATSISLSKSSCSLGQRVLNAGWDTKTGLAVCASIISKINRNSMECVVLSTNEHRGGPLLNMDGEVVGILGLNGANQSVIDLDTISDFLQRNLHIFQNNSPASQN